ARFEREARVPLPEPVTEPLAPAARGSFAELWRQPYRPRPSMLIVFNLFQTVRFYGFSNWVPSFLIKQGIAVTTSLAYTFVIAIAAPFGPLLAALVSDRIERKWMIAGSALLVAAFGLVFAGMSEAVPLILFGALITLANNVM